ncbi:MAG: energy transducer TonB [Limnobacter sp.]|nr:energy transducer TonB [Limnobacter sp.]
MPVTPPQTIEVMLMELPAEQPEVTELPTPQTPPQTPPPPKVQAPKVQPPPVLATKIIEPAKPAPIVEQAADINTGEKTPPPAAKPLPALAVQTPVELPKNQSPQPDTAREVSPARVDARYASSNPRPQYPSMARRLGQEGTVVLEVTVSTEGLAKSVRIQDSSGHELLDQAAVNAISKWKFVPAKRGDTPIEQKLNTRWTYKLEE